jgi:hypothetical protein
VDTCPAIWASRSLVVGFYRGKDLIYVARVRAGLVPGTPREVFERIKPLKTPKCPFANLPELTAGPGVKDSPQRR